MITWVKRGKKPFPGGTRAVLGLLLLGSLAFLSGCGQAGEAGRAAEADRAGNLGRTGEEKKTLSMGTFTEGSDMDTAGLAVATALNLSGEGLDVAVERTKGSPANLLNLCDGDLDLAMVSGDAAYWAWNGAGIFEGEPKKEFRVLAACYPVMSCFLGADSSLSYVHDLKGKVLSIGTEGSDTAQASAAVFSVLGIDETNTELWNYGLSGGAGGIRDGWADGIHGFSRMPVSSWLELFGEEKPVVLKYTEEELARLLEENPGWQRLSLPKDTYPGQTEAVETFGFKALLCVPASMDEALAYEITKALDTKGEPVLSGHAFLKSMEQKEFLCHDLPAPLHPGAERYYKECGYIR